MYDMTIRLRTDSGKCLYEQIYEHIRKEISYGKLLTGEKLPSTRFLAEYLQVARSTVDYAYGQLLDEGYIEARPCKGYFVCPVKELFQMEEEKRETGQAAWTESKRSHEKTRTESGESRGGDQTGMEAVRQGPLVGADRQEAPLFQRPASTTFLPMASTCRVFPLTPGGRSPKIFSPMPMATCFPGAAPREICSCARPSADICIPPGE